MLVNDRAARIAREADGLLLHNAIAAATPEATRRLREAVAATASDTACESPRLGLERPSGRPPLLLTLMPIWRLGTQVLGGADAPRVAIFIKETYAPLVIDRRLLAESLRLTQRESEVAALLADGLDLAEVAGRLGQGIGTARSHLKRVFDKTGARARPRWSRSCAASAIRARQRRIGRRAAAPEQGVAVKRRAGSLLPCPTRLR